jgi:hypothetical protein
MKAGLERRLSDLEATAEPSKGFKIRSLADLVNWAEVGDDIPPDLSECPDSLLRAIYDATKDDEEGEP